MKKYAAHFEYGRPQLSEIEVSKETPRTISAVETKRMFGYMFFGKR